MSPEHQRIIKRSIANYGIQLSSEVMWFIDEHTIFYGKKQPSGEISDYLSGYISGQCFVVGFSTQKERLDICGWDDFFSQLEITYIDARY